MTLTWHLVMTEEQTVAFASRSISLSSWRRWTRLLRIGWRSTNSLRDR